MVHATKLFEFERIASPSEGVLEDWGISVNQSFENRQIPPFQFPTFTQVNASQCLRLSEKPVIPRVVIGVLSPFVQIVKL